MTQIVTEVARPRPMYAIGDANTLAFNNLMFVDDVDGRGYVSYAKHVFELNSQNVLDGAGQLHPAITKALLAEGLLTIHGELPVATHRLPEEIRGPYRGTEDPVIILFIGHMDVRGIAAGIDQTTTDLHLPYVLPNADLFEGPTDPQHLIVWESIQASVDYKAGRIFAALRLLLDLGFANVFLHSVPPQAPPDGNLPPHRRAPFKASLVEYRLASVFNRTFADNASNIGYRFINCWDAVTTQNQLRPAFSSGGVALNKFAARESIRLTLSALNGTSAEVSFMEPVHPIYLLGDANVLPLNGRVFTLAGYDAEYQIVHSHYLPDFSLQTVIEPNGAMHQRFMEALVSDLVVWIDVVDRYATGLHTGNSMDGEIYAKSAGAARRDPPLVLSCGEHDLPRLRSADEPTLVHAVEPLVIGAASLRSIGFNNLALRGAPEKDDAARRYNAVLAKRAVAAGLKYLPAAEVDVLEPLGSFILESKREALEAAYLQLNRRAASALNGAGERLDAALRDEFKKNGSVRVIAPRAPVAEFLAGVRFGGKVSAWKSLDWCSDGLIGLGWDRAAPIDANLLKLVTAIFYASPVRETVMSVIGSRFSIFNVRILRRGSSVPKREPKPVPAPPGVIKAFMHLNGGRPDVITLARTELEFEAAQKLPPAAVFADFVIVPMDIWGCELAVGAGPYGWPVDPINPVFDGAVTYAPT